MPWQSEAMKDVLICDKRNAVTVISIANLSGRLVLGILSDKIARIRVITIGQVISLVGMAALLFAPLNAVTFFAAIACVAFNFGGTITVFPSLVSEFFGLNNLTRRVEIMTNRGQHAGDIWRTTSAAKPTLADRFNVIVDMVEFQRFWMYFQRIHIEEMFAVQRHA